MNTKTTLPISEARRKIFSIARYIQKPGTYYTLTERGKPTAVIISAKKFEQMADHSAIGNHNPINQAHFHKAAMVLADRPSQSYRAEGALFFQKILVVRDQSKIVYLSDARDETKYKRAELIKAQLFIELIEKYKYPLDRIELGKYVKIGGAQSKRYIEADLVVSDKNGNVEMIFETTTFEDYEDKQKETIKDLFDLAGALSWSKRPKHLIYFSKRLRQGKTEEKILAIDCSQSRAYLSWKKSGMAFDNKIPYYNGD